MTPKNIVQVEREEGSGHARKKSKKSGRKTISSKIFTVPARGKRKKRKREVSLCELFVNGDAKMEEEK